jgi:hypothetical protein
MPRRIPLALLSAILVGCSQEPSGPGPDAEAQPGTVLGVSDAPHDGNPHFYWLSPLVSSSPVFTGLFDGTQVPTVTVCSWTGSACASQIATFSSSSGSLALRVDVSNEYYIANWKTGAPATKSGELYRVIVELSGWQLGYADIRLGSSGQFRNGATIPLKFRLEQGAILYSRVADISNSYSTLHINPADQVGATVPALDGEMIQGLVSKGAEGEANALIEVRKFALNDRTAADIVQYDGSGRPLKATLRNDDQMAFDYAVPGVVTMTLTLHTGIIRATSFPFDLSGSAQGISTRSGPDPENTSSFAAQPNAATVAGTSSQPFTITVVDGSGSPVSGGTISGTYGSSSGTGSFNATGSAPGTYVFNLPTLASSLSQNQVSTFCSALQSSSFGSACQFIKHGSPVPTASFYGLAAAACLALGPYAVACEAVVASLQVVCELVKDCKNFQKVIDFFVQLQSTAPVTINAVFYVGSCSSPVVGAVQPIGPLALSVTTACLPPGSGGGGGGGGGLPVGPAPCTFEGNNWAAAPGGGTSYNTTPPPVSPAPATATSGDTYWVTADCAASYGVLGIQQYYGTAPDGHWDWASWANPGICVLPSGCGLNIAGVLSILGGTPFRIIFQNIGPDLSKWDWTGFPSGSTMYPLPPPAQTGSANFYYPLP